VAWGLNSQLKLFTGDTGSGSDTGSGVGTLGNTEDSEQIQFEVASSSAPATSLKQEEAQLWEERGDFIYTEEGT